LPNATANGAWGAAGAEFREGAVGWDEQDELADPGGDRADKLGEWLASRRPSRGAALLLSVATKEGNAVKYVIAEPCADINDKACIEECPVDCIYEGARMNYIHPDECVDCGACEPVCPVAASYYEDERPDQWSAYTQINTDYFAERGSAGGASKVGITENEPVALKDLVSRK